jgi:hypothetical protein
MANRATKAGKVTMTAASVREIAEASAREGARQDMRLRNPATGRLAAALAAGFLFAACNALLPGGFEFTFENGAGCAQSGDCASGHCSFDGVCCAEACGGRCQSCKGGAACSPVPEDAKGACTGNDVCSAEGRCYCSNQRFLGPSARPTYPTGVTPVSVAALDLNGDGKPDLAIANRDDDTVSVLRNLGDGTFAAKVDYSTGSKPSDTKRRPSSVAALDLNGDGKPDLAVTSSDEGTVSVLLNLGNGSFAFKDAYATGLNPYSVAALDLNGDGKPDLAVANGADDTVSVLLNLSNGNFFAPLVYKTGDVPSSIAALDLNGDGKPDLATANQDGASVSVLLNLGNGSFAPQPPLFAIPGGAPTSITALDLNGDGKPDFATSNIATMSDQMSTVGVLLNQGDGTFPTLALYEVGQSPRQILALDLNADGKPDLVIANADDNTVSVLLGKSDGTFASQAVYPTGLVPVALAALDLNADGKPDLAIANAGDNTVSVLLNLGDGIFPTPDLSRTYPTDGGPEVVATLDLNADGKLDLVTTNGGPSFSVLLGQEDGSFAPPKTYPSPTRGAVVALAALDMDGDGKTDLVTANELGTPRELDSVSVLRNLGNGTFGFLITVPTREHPGSVVAVDLNGDEKPDIVTASRTANKVSVLLHNGDGTFARKDYDTGSFPFAITAMDLDGDGKRDLAVANHDADTVSVLLNNGDGHFAKKVDYLTGNQRPSSPSFLEVLPSAVAALDVDGDGKPDLAVANQGDNTVSVLRNLGKGTFAARVDYPTGVVPSSVTALDVDGDGKPDLAVTNYLGSSVTVLRNNGDGTFSRVDYATGRGPSSLTPLDVNGDSRPGLAIANRRDNTVTVLLNACP